MSEGMSESRRMVEVIGIEGNLREGEVETGRFL